MREEVQSFEMADGISLRLTRRLTGSRGLILVVPGILMHRESAEHRLLAERLAAIADVATLDVRGHGDSGGAFTFGRREPEDVAAVAAALRRDYERVAGLGFSFGGYHIALAAALYRSFDAVALVATPHRLFVFDHNFVTRGLLRSLPVAVRRKRRQTRLAFTTPSRREPPSRLVDRIAPAPLLIAHGTADWLIPEKHAHTLYQRAREPKTLVLIEGGLHAENILVDEPEPLLAPLAEFFERALN